MKIIHQVLIFAFFSAAGAGVSIEAQTRGTGGGADAVKSNKSKSTKPRSFDIANVDFKNFTFPEFSRAQSGKTFTLVNGRAGKNPDSPAYTLRKTYYFDLTGDRKNEAVSHILADGCQLGCESSSLFYIHTADASQPRLLWKIAIGGNTLGGLKSASFKIDEIVLETFGECSLDDWLIKAELNIDKNPKMKTTSYTRFVFTRDGEGFQLAGREVLPLASLNLTRFRAKISFGE